MAAVWNAAASQLAAPAAAVGFRLGTSSLLDLDYEQPTSRARERECRLTDVHGTVVQALVA